jgi:tRNA 2-thiouridine synthesizing protein B
MLHTVNKSPFERSAFDDCLRRVAPGSVVLLIEDGVYAAVQHTAAARRLESTPDTVRFVALRADVDARGLHGKLLPRLELIDYGGFVDLVVEQKTTMAWL